MTDDFESPKTSADETDMRTRKAWSTPQLTVSAADAGSRTGRPRPSRRARWALLREGAAYRPSALSMASQLKR
jgi:hypothetical protein